MLGVRGQGWGYPEEGLGSEAGRLLPICQTCSDDEVITVFSSDGFLTAAEQYHCNLDALQLGGNTNVQGSF